MMEMEFWVEQGSFLYARLSLVLKIENWYHISEYNLHG